MPRGSYQGRRFYVEGKDRTVLWSVAVLFALLSFRLFSLQVIKGEHYLAMSEENRVRIVPVEPPRGLVYDRNGVLLVDNYPSYTVSALLHEVTDIDETLMRLGTVCGLEGAEMAHIQSRSVYNFGPVKIKRDVPFDVVASIEENCLDLPGILCQVEPKRRYVYGETASHILGYTGEISEKELRKFRNMGYLCGWAIGKDGIERSYEEDLKGHNGFKYLEVNAKGREIGLLPGNGPISPIPGKNLFLTIDIRLQRVAETVFKDGWVGSLVALDPQTGEILAMVSKPEFDSNQFSSVLTAEDWADLHTNPKHPLLNRAIGSCYPPGSTLKIVTAAAGLEMGRIDSNTRFRPCTGEMAFGNRVFHCWVPDGHGSPSLRGAIVQSCDIFFYQLGQKMGVDAWARYARIFGFGQRTGVDLQGEDSGLVPSSEYYNKRYGKRKWSPNVVLNLAVGQGEVLATPLQLAVFAGTIGMKGRWCQPHVVKGVELPQTGVVMKKNVLTRQMSEISPGTFEELRKAMIDVVNDAWGTGKASALEGVTVAGKTGTAQNPHGEDHAWFMCFAPADDPVIAVALVVENGGKGGSVAAPMAQKVVRAYLFDTYEEEFTYGQPAAKTY